MHEEDLITLLKTTHNQCNNSNINFIDGSTYGSLRKNISEVNLIDRNWYVNLGVSNYFIRKISNL